MQALKALQNAWREFQFGVVRAVAPAVVQRLPGDEWLNCDVWSATARALAEHSSEFPLMANDDFLGALPEHMEPVIQRAVDLLNEAAK